MKNRHSKTAGGSSLDTLAQSGTRYFPESAVIIAGQGSELISDKSIKGRAKKKFLTLNLVLALIKIAEKKGKTGNIKSLWNTYHCLNKVYTHEGRLHGKYCKNRFCTICGSIRKADIINRYYPVISQWEQPYFVTLTAKAVPKKILRDTMKAFMRGFDRIHGKYKKKAQRGNGKKLMGVKSLECNFNPQRYTYNVHFHLIVEDKEMAEILVKEWLALWKEKNGIVWSQPYCQKIKAVYNLDTALIEIIKYGSKIFTMPDVDKKAKMKTQPHIYASALDNILEAMKGLRIFERFGFNLPAGSKREPAGTKAVKNIGEWIYHPEYFDWLHVDNELILSSYAPNAGLLNLLENNIDLEAE